MLTLARSIALLSWVAALAIAPASFGTESAGGAVPLPVRKVMLYKNGMGYFEHVGDVTGAEPIDIVLSSAQLNDVLKSLTVIDLAPAPVVSVTYDSTKPADRELSELPIKLGNFAGMTSFLNEIRGSDVEIDVAGGPLVGRLMGADVRKKELGSAGTAEVIEVTVFVAGGELRTVDLAAAKALRLRGRELTAGVQRYLEVLEMARRQDMRRLRIQTRGEGPRKLFVGYTSEAPVWKTTYRFVLDDARKPLLQGWAIVDNTTAMDWNDVELTLVAGAPISFIQKLSEPVYARRPEVPLAEAMGPRPQVHAITAASPPPAPPMGASPRGAPAPMVSEEVLLSPPAEGRQVGEQFEYRLPHPVTLARNQSAMLPIVHAEVEGEKVAIWNARSAEAHPRTAVWLTNTSGLTLAPGAFTVIEAGGFAGEGLTETIHPAERRLLSYGRDLAVSVAAKQPRANDRIERVVVRDGVIRWQVLMQSEVTYVVNSQHARPRIVILEHPIEAQFTLAPGHTPMAVESTASAHRFRVTVGPRSTTELVVRTQKPEQTTIAIDDRMSRDQIALWLRERRIDGTIEQALAPVIEGFEEVRRLANRGAKIDDEVKRIFEDQGRVRENLAKLGQGADEAALRLRYVRQLEDQEKRFDGLRAEKARVDTAQSDAERRVDQLVKDLAVDRTL